MERDLVTGFNNSATAVDDRSAGFNQLDTGPIPVPLHPFSLGTTRIGAEPEDLTPVEAVERFARKISENLTKDYGDWMRDANFFWWELAASLREQSGIWDLMNGLHEVIQYAPDWQPLDTCRLALELAIEIRDRLGGGPKREPHDYGISETEQDTPESN